MKNLCLILSSTTLTLLLLLNPPHAKANRASNLVLGTGDGGFILGALGDSGSFIHEDRYNIFYNPSYAADNQDWAIVEKYDGISATGSNALDGAAGGFMTSFATFTFGFYFNRAGAVDSSHYTGAANGAANYRPLDFIFAGDLGFKFGLGLSYGSFDDGSSENKDLTLRLGTQIADFDPFLHYQITGRNSDGSSTDLILAGLRYHWGQWNPIIAYRHHRSGGSTDSRRWGLGLSRFTEGSEGVRYGFSVSYWRDSSAGISLLPFEIMIQGKVTTWLILRAGLQHPIVNRQNGLTLSDRTTGRVGASLIFGSLDFDFAVGSGDASSAAADDGDQNTTTTPIDKPTFGFDDSLFSAASLTYHW